MTVVEALMVTAELCGTSLSELAAQVLAEDLSEYDEAQVLGALRRCRDELRGKLTMSEIMGRLADGRPSADEAYAMLPWDEQASCVMTQEMAEAMEVARPAYETGDRAGARFAFREVYARKVNDARREKRPPEWFPSLGTDPASREEALRAAVARGRLPAAQVNRLLPAGREVEEPGRKALPQGQRGLPPALPPPANVRALLRDLVGNEVRLPREEEGNEQAGA